MYLPDVTYVCDLVRSGPHSVSRDQDALLQQDTPHLFEDETIRLEATGTKNRASEMKVKTTLDQVMAHR